MAVSTRQHTAYVALGSNLSSVAGDPAATIKAALLVLSKAAQPLRLRASSLYSTAPVGLAEQPAFINAVASVETPLEPEALLESLLSIEQRFGRERHMVNGPRTLDLDLLMVDDLVLSTAVLVLPHPRMAHRRFVLAPLVEIAPQLVHPVSGQSMAALLADLPNVGEQVVLGVRRLAAVTL